ncbi:MAG: hypothetical protein MZW92_09075 [Comamonadaceae bacterium]|nr:hypothetical protein [Comamonadaceae bacterium]
MSQSGALTLVHSGLGQPATPWASPAVVSLGPNTVGGHRPGARLPGLTTRRRRASSCTSKASPARAAS